MRILLACSLVAAATIAFAGAAACRHDDGTAPSPSTPTGPSATPPAPAASFPAATGPSAGGGAGP